MENIIAPVNKELMLSELTKDKFVRKTNYGARDIYIVDIHNAPNVVREIGRLRELAFRDGGGGTGKDVDLDAFDTCENPFKQLLVWDPVDREIIGGYRFLHCSELPYTVDNELISPTGELFKYSEKFIHQYLPYTIELGRSFVRPEYQPSFDTRKGMFSLDNLWDGLGVIASEYSSAAKYLFGKMTNYSQYNAEARDILLYFLDKYFGEHDNLITPIYPIIPVLSKEELSNFFKNDNFKDDYKELHLELRNRKEMIPPLFNAYMNLSTTMKVFGTSINHHFGEVEETAILITIKDINEDKQKRYIHSYKAKNFFDIEFRIPKIRKRKRVTK